MTPKKLFTMWDAYLKLGDVRTARDTWINSGQSPDDAAPEYKDTLSSDEFLLL